MGFDVLGRNGMHEGVSRCTKDRYEDLCRFHFAGLCVIYRKPRTAEIDEQFVAGKVDLAHGGIEGGCIAGIML